MTVYNDKVSQYVTDTFVDQDDALRVTMEDIPKKGLPTINIKPEEGRFLQVLVRASGVNKAIEIGTLGGYSGIWIARGLLPGGKLVTLEKEPYHAQVASEHFRLAGVQDQVEIRIGNAHESLHQLAPLGPYDFIFIDAEKDGYDDYFTWALDNTRLGGVIAAHNAFRKGSVAGTAEKDAYTEGMQAFNRRVAAEPRVLSTIYPAGDGMIIAVKTR